MSTTIRGSDNFDTNPSGLGKVLQVKQAVKTDTMSFSAVGPTTITGLSVTITPKNANSKFLIMTTINYDSTKGNSGGGFLIYRNGSAIESARGEAAGNRYRVFGDFGANANADQSGMSRSFQYIDSPASASSIIYDIRAFQDNTSYTTYINRARVDADQGDDPRMASSIIVMEIGE